MAKKHVSIAETRMELKKRQQRLECLSCILSYCETQLKWSMVDVHDENDDIVIDDETGERVQRPPVEGEYEYATYVAWHDIAEEIASLC